MFPRRSGGSSCTACTPSVATLTSMRPGRPGRCGRPTETGGAAGGTPTDEVCAVRTGALRTGALRTGRAHVHVPGDRPDVDHVARVVRVDHVVAADVQADVVDRGVEEQEVARLKIAAVDVRKHLILHLGG